MPDRMDHVSGEARGALPTYEYTYSSTTTGANFATQLSANTDWDGISPCKAIIHVNSGIDLYNGTQTGGFPAGTVLELDNQGTIRGTNCNGDDGLSLGHDCYTYGGGTISGGGGSAGSGGSSGGCGSYCVPDGEGGSNCYPNPPQPGSPGSCGGYGQAGTPGSPGGCGGSPGGAGGAAGYAVRENGYSYTDDGSITLNGSVG